MSPAPRVLLVDDHRLFRECLRLLLERKGRVDVVGEAANGEAALEIAATCEPDVILLDVALPDQRGPAVARQLREAVPSARIVALSMHTEPNYVLAMLEAGCTGYVVKDTAFDDLVGAVQAAMDSQVYLSPAIAHVVVDAYQRGRPANAESELTPREIEVACLIAEGYSTRRAAEVLQISVRTVETHRRRIMEKLGLGNAAQLTRYVIDTGLAVRPD